MFLYAATIFVSAFLLFQVQPLIAKIILPWFGGAAGVWTTCMLFFQMLLLGGYIYAHWVTRKLSAVGQFRLHFLLLLLSAAALPILPSSDWKPAAADDPSLRILGLLAATVGLPYLILSTTGPLVQAWFARDGAMKGRSPYRLYALSNVASMLALLSYPFVIEPLIPTRMQAYTWSAGYVAFVVLCFLVARKAASGAAPETHASDHASTSKPTLGNILVWTALTACASSFFLSVSNQLSQNVASIPFLWVLPLSIYLLSFILCFDAPAWYRRSLFLGLFGVALILLTIVSSLKPGYLPLSLNILIYLASLFVACMVCHGEFVRLKPASEHLTTFYVSCAMGGAVGGLFVGILAPYAFTGYYEFPITIFGSGLLLLFLLRGDPDTLAYRKKSSSDLLIMLHLFLGAFLLLNAITQSKHAVAMLRNFYGGMRIVEEGEGDAKVRRLIHGTIVHGTQQLSAEGRRTPLAYFHKGAGAGRALTSFDQPIHVGIIGLGTGTLAAYGKAGDRYRFYELNQQVLDVARSQFTFLSDSQAKITHVIGDARLSLEAEQPQQFDVFIVDAFSSDSIPVHLLTRESFAVYFRHLKPDGMLMLHITNLYLDLRPVVHELATALGKECRIIRTEPNPTDYRYPGSTWMFVTSNTSIYQRQRIVEVAQTYKPDKQTPIWTDDYSNLYRILK